MVRLHVVDYKVVQAAALEYGFYLAEEISVRAVFNGIYEYVLFILDYVGVV